MSDTKERTAGICLLGALILLVILALDFLLCAGLTGLVLWCFEIEFTWAIALGVWLMVRVAIPTVARQIRE